MKYKFRNAKKTDVQQIAELHAQSWKLNYRHSFRKDYLDLEVDEDRLKIWTKRYDNLDPCQGVIIAEKKNQLQGFVCTFLDFHEEWGAYLDNLHVQPVLYGQGLGRQLMAKTAEWVIQKRPDSPLYLWVLEKNVQGLRFYLRHGGVNQGSKIFYNPGGGQSNAYRIEWIDPRTLL